MITTHLPFAGPAALWALALHHGGMRVDSLAPYRRRSPRNRTTILTAQGPATLSIPVQLKKARLYRDTRLNYDTRWPQQTLHALRTAYNASPFFALLEDELTQILLAGHTFLWDLNMALALLIIRTARLPIPLTEADEGGPCDGPDLRRPFDNEQLAALARPVPYYQVFATPFADRPFQPGLSMLDALFNLGPETILTLRQMTPTCSTPTT